ncbi:MAG TPA: hypothetical protein VM848_03645 [Acidimicrobiia bacterium]|nr:hypothetical protein [Acidimicrobiia bacterium]
MDLVSLRLIRLRQLEMVLPLFLPRGRILEFGAGPRYQAADLADVLLDLVDSQDERSRLGALARQRIAEQFALDLMVRRYVSLYKDLVTHVRD